MKGKIENVYTMKNVEFEFFVTWQEVQKVKKELYKWVKSLNLGKRIKQFWRNFKVQIMMAGTALLWVASIIIIIFVI